MSDVKECPPPENGIWSMAYIVELINAGNTSSVTFIPEETVPVSWNGVEVLLTRGVEIEVPKFHYDVYQQSRRDTIAAFRNAQGSLERRSFGVGQTSVTSGWNGNVSQ